MPPGTPEAHRRAFISSTTMEFPVQRRWAASIFILLQAWKLSDLLLTYTSTDPTLSSTHMVKWWIYDTLYLIVLYIMRIPWLQFSLLKTIVLIFTLLMTNLILFVMPTFSMSSLFISHLMGDVMGHQIGVSKARMVNVKDILYNSSHLLGRHTVHILPHGTAKLNPNDEFYCLPQNGIGKTDVYIPIILNNTIPRTIELSHLDFESGEEDRLEFKGHSILRATEVGQSKEGLEYYYVKVKKTGMYKLENIVADSMDVRLYKRQVYVFTCPSAKFTSFPSEHRCLGDKASFEIEVIGVPPLRIEYQVGNEYAEKPFQLDRIQPEGEFSSPLQRAADGTLDHTIQTDEFSWASVHYLPMKLNVPIPEASEYHITLTKVIDGAGNSLDLSDVSSRSFHVHQRPQVNFGCSGVNPVYLLHGQSSVQLPLQLQGSYPIEVTYQYMDHSTTQLLKEKDTSLAVTKPGEYSLSSVSDRYCPGDILLPSHCQVVQPKTPALELTSTPIPSECGNDSEIGMTFYIEFTGTPPYSLDYTISRDGRIVDRKTENINRSRHTFTYIPRSSGKYRYDFVSMSDNHYKQRPVHIPPIHQVVHPQPDAQFSLQSHSIDTCLGDEDLNVDVELRGTGPFELVWSLGKEEHVDNVNGNHYTIPLPPFDTAGEHVVSLVSIKDGNGCFKKLSSRDYHVNVRSDRPTASFHVPENTEALAEVVEHQVVELPIRLTGEAPWTLTYRHVESGALHRGIFRDPNASIKVSDIGTYRLESVSDATCKGDILPSDYLVRWLDKPVLSVPEDQVTVISRHHYQRAPVCQNKQDSFDVQFSGHGPFSCSYRHNLVTPSKMRDHVQLIKKNTISTAMNRVNVPLYTQKGGLYRYVFDELADQKYAFTRIQPPIQVDQVVYPTPSAKFHHERPLTLCVGETLKSTESVYVDFTGTAPFTLKLGIHHASEVNGVVVVVENIMTPRYKLQLDHEFDKPGRYQLSLLHVSDSHECEASIEGASLLLEALDIPSITPTESCSDLCVGDKLDFSLYGMGPFTVSYQFNDKTEALKSSTSKLHMIADKPGNITILSVGDQRNKCKWYPKDMTRHIHDLPASRISGGKEIIENIHQGDMVQAEVDLIGTPPFDFEWRRSELVWDTQHNRHYKGSVLESHAVYNVQEHKYYINTSVEGIIEVKACLYCRCTLHLMLISLFIL
ncbi:hypothetical protein BDB01DRAFT_749580 [Pilobolus umbonatus]|nr:hypothetical protein BDB01DRAFT_749580 [Pilobolus umbonatus]